MFSALTDKLEDAFRKLRGLGKISESNVADAMREIRLALLEADVDFKVTKDLIEAVKQRALGEEVLKNVIDPDDKAVTIETIQKFISDYYQLKVGELKSRNNSKSVAMPRQIAMYLCKTLTHASLPEIGKSFGGKHHSTVIHSIRKVEELRKKDGDFNTLINSFVESFR